MKKKLCCIALAGVTFLLCASVLAVDTPVAVSKFGSARTEPVASVPLVSCEALVAQIAEENNLSEADIAKLREIIYATPESTVPTAAAHTENCKFDCPHM